MPEDLSVRRRIEYSYVLGEWKQQHVHHTHGIQSQYEAATVSIYPNRTLLCIPAFTRSPIESKIFISAS
jgi:hypothetical protein